LERYAGDRVIVVFNDPVVDLVATLTIGLALTHELPVCFPNSATLIASVVCLHPSHEGSTMRADFVSQAYFRNPAAEIEKLRSAGPVVEVQFPMIGKVWITTTQDLADRVLKDSKTSPFALAPAPLPDCSGGCPASCGLS
jgi:hypothetical protein